jgi:Uma2 family endonuclease
MVSQLQPLSQSEVIYPDSDGKPRANNTKQLRWILVIQKNLDRLFADDPNVFVAGDLFWYPVEGKPNIVNAPDVMVVLGRPKGDSLAEQARRDAIPRLLEMGLSVEQVAEALGLLVEEVKAIAQG